MGICPLHAHIRAPNLYNLFPYPPLPSLACAHTLQRDVYERACHPEIVCSWTQVSRTYTFGRNGTHAGEGFDDHLSVMQLNTEDVDWRQMDLKYLLRDRYTHLLYDWMDKAEVRVTGFGLKPQLEQVLGTTTNRKPGGG